MSYILEALKKAEQARLATKLPDIKSMTLSADEPVRGPPAWLYGAALVAVVAGATGLGWWFSGKPHETVMLEKPADVPPAVGREMAQASLERSINRAKDISAGGGGARSHEGIKPPPSTVFSSAPVMAPHADVRPMEPGQVDAGSKRRGVVGAVDEVMGKVSSPERNDVANPSDTASAVPDKNAALSRKNKPAAAVPAPAISPGPKPSPGSRVFRVDELPPEVRRDVPKISATGYVDSADAGGRVVSINERSLREGDELIAGMTLEQIAQDHVLFSFRGYRFRVEMF